jgi:hypothetical protein
LQTLLGKPEAGPETAEAYPVEFSDRQDAAAAG